MKKRILALVAVTLLFFITACGKQTNAYETESYDIESDVVETYQYGYQDLLISGLEPYGFQPYDEEYDVPPEGAEKASEELAEEVNSLGREIVDFLNQKYDLGWKYTEIPVYTFSENSEWGGFYFPKYKSMYINIDSDFGKLEKELSPSFEWVIAHELTHGITDQNRGTPFFFKEISSDETMGVFLHEGITEILTEQFMATKGITPKDAYPEGGSSGYIAIVYYLKASEFSFEGTINDMLNDDMSAVETRMENAVGDELAFDRWLCLIDITQFVMMESDENPFFCIEAMTEYLWYTTQDEEELLATINEFFDTVFGYYTDEYQFETIEEAIYTLDMMSYDEEDEV